MANQKELEQILTKEFLLEQYVVQDKFAADIASEVGCSTVTVTRYLRIHDIPVTRKYCNPNRAKVDLSNLTPEFLLEEYIGKRKPVYKLARELNTTARSLKKKLDEFGIAIENHRENAPTTFSSGLTDIGGYLAVKIAGHPRADSRGYVKLHVIIAEYYLGRFLEPDEVIHHKNLNKWDNIPENLVLTTPSQHSLIHNNIRWHGEELIDMLTLPEIKERQESQDKKPER